jgi:type I restriction enzyme S subunit
MKGQIKDVCSAVYSGGTPNKKHPEYYEAATIPWLNTGEIAFNRIHNTEKFISEAGLNNSSAKWVPENTVIVAMYGATAARAAITKIPLTTNQACCNLVVDEAKADYRYVYYWLCNQYSHLASLANGGAQQNLNAGQIKDYPIEILPLDKQKKIADVLSAIDDKIENNEKINRNLFQQAQTLYKDRFIDMKPFDGIMPVDWHCGTVSEIIELHDSKRIPLSSRERADLTKVYPYYGATSIMDYVDRYLFDGIYLLLSEDGTVVDDKGYPILQYVEGKFWVNNHAHILTGKSGFNVELLYLLFSLTSVKAIVTGAVQPKISQANLNKVPVVIPSTNELRQFDDCIQPIFAEIRNLRNENAKLTALRDGLLPKLMSGEMDISDIDL